MSDQTGWKPVLLMSKVPYAGEYHRHLALVSGGNYFFVTNRTARLNRAGCASFGRRDQPVRERKKASLATALPLSESPASFAFQTAIREASTRDI